MISCTTYEACVGISTTVVVCVMGTLIARRRRRRIVSDRFLLTLGVPNDLLLTNLDFLLEKLEQLHPLILLR